LILTASLSGPTHSPIIIAAVWTASGAGLSSRPKEGIPQSKECHAE